MAEGDGAEIPPLGGLRVIDCSRFMPGAYFGWIAADLGADVIQVEHPGQLAKWRAANASLSDEEAQMLRARQSWRRNKRSLVLNPGHAASAAVMHALVQSADVFIEDYRAGVFDSLGLGYEALSRVNPRLIYCSVSLAGRTGPCADRAGHDPIALALSGALSRIGNTPRPTLPGLQVADTLAGAHAAIGILSALQARERTGRGRHVDCAMSDACLPLGAITLARAADPAALPPPDGAWHPKGGIWECRCGGFLCTTDMEPAYWRRFCDVIGRPDLATRQHDRAAHAGMEQEIAAIMRTRTRDEWAALLSAADTQAMPVLSLGEAIAHEHNRARKMVVEVAAGEASVCQIGAPHGLGTDLPSGSFAAAKPGEHSAEILAGLGFDAEAVRRSGAMDP